MPDVAGWRREQMPKYPETAYVTLAPDWVCEVLSASTRPARPSGQAPGLRSRRQSGTCGSSTRLDRTLEAFELREGEWVLIAAAKDDDPISIRPFDAITFQPGGLSGRNADLRGRAGRASTRAGSRGLGNVRREVLDVMHATCPVVVPRSGAESNALVAATAVCTERQPAQAGPVKKTGRAGKGIQAAAGAASWEVSGSMPSTSMEFRATSRS